MEHRRQHDSHAEPRARARGFTLIELVIAVAIVGLLTAVALPAYVEHVRKAARADAQTFLADAGARQQQFLVDRRAYAGSFAGLGVTPPAALAEKFDFALGAADGPPPTFTLRAQARGGQAADKCPTLTLDSAGVRTPAACW